MKKIRSSEGSIVAMSKDGNSEFAQGSSTGQGAFVDWATGDYILDLKKAAKNRVRSSPRTFTVIAGEMVCIDLDVVPAFEPM
jgi:hypothetical protein